MKWLTPPERAGIVNMVNLTYRNVAALQKARAHGAGRRVGEVRHVEASYLQSWLVSKSWGDWRTDPKWLWRLSRSHGSNGVLGDVGVHILDFASYGAGLDIEHVFCRLKTFDKAPGNRIGEYELDANDSFTMALDFSNGAFGVVHASRWATGHLNELRLRIYGDKGGIEVVHNLEGSQLKVCMGEDIETAKWQDDRCRLGADQLPALRRCGAQRRRRPNRRSATRPNCRRCWTLPSSRTRSGQSCRAHADTQ